MTPEQINQLTDRDLFKAAHDRLRETAPADTTPPLALAFSQHSDQHDATRPDCRWEWCALVETARAVLARPAALTALPDSQRRMIAVRHAAVLERYGDRDDPWQEYATAGELDRWHLMREVERLEAERGQMAERVRELDRDLDEVMKERDEYNDLLDQFAAAVAPVEVIGEHSSGNDPWANALELVTSAARVRELEATVAERGQALIGYQQACGQHQRITFAERKRADQAEAELAAARALGDVARGGRDHVATVAGQQHRDLTAVTAERDRLAELVDVDPLALRDEAIELLARAEQAEAAEDRLRGQLLRVVREWERRTELIRRVRLIAAGGPWSGDPSAEHHAIVAEIDQTEGPR
jgi:hypothetical protein